ncbi:MAG: outer membrane beta-barrel protein [Rhodospirillales bacterium]|nr:outer membrane beta-barrel protein [Rhodospirillales bacterium]
MTSIAHKLLPAALLAAMILPAQQPSGAPASAQAAAQPAAAQPAPEPEVKNWRAGVKFSGQFLDLFDEASLNTFDSIPWRFTSSATTDISNRLGFGLTFGYDISRRVSLNLDVLYRRAGYRSGLEITEGEDDLDTIEDERKITSGFEQTKADYWDLPFTLRVHDGPASRRVRGFFEVGGALRHATSIRTYTELEQPGQGGSVDTTAAKPANANVLGAVVGAGWDWRTSKGINVVPQVRYTHWMNPVFDSARTRSSRNQIEFMLGITF